MNAEIVTRLELSLDGHRAERWAATASADAVATAKVLAEQMENQITELREETIRLGAALDQGVKLCG